MKEHHGEFTIDDIRAMRLRQSKGESGPLLTIFDREAIYEMEHREEKRGITYGIQRPRHVDSIRRTY